MIDEIHSDAECLRRQLKKEGCENPEKTLDDFLEATGLDLSDVLYHRESCEQLFDYAKSGALPAEPFGFDHSELIEKRVAHMFESQKWLAAHWKGFNRETSMAGEAEEVELQPSDYRDRVRFIVASNGEIVRYEHSRGYPQGHADGYFWSGVRVERVNGKIIARKGGKKAEYQDGAKLSQIVEDFREEWWKK